MRRRIKVDTRHRHMLRVWKRNRTMLSRRGHYAPSLWPVQIVLPTAVLATSVLGYGLYTALRRLAPASSTLDVIKVAVIVAGFFGAALAGVYAYRKQRLAEGDAHRADAEQLASRYTSAAEQLGHEKAAVRLAGAYAMARLADDWPEQRPTCINVLCAIRMPYDPDISSPSHQEGEREVRHTIISTIRDHLQDPDDPTTWCGHYLDFTGAIFDGADFTNVHFTAKVSFSGARFIGGNTSFRDAKFSGPRITFNGAKFTGGLAHFNGAEFSDGLVLFGGAEFTNPHVGFNRAKFSGGEVSFRFTRFAHGHFSFSRAEFTGALVSFESAKFTGAWIGFLEAEFASGELDFSGSVHTGGEVDFTGARHTGGHVQWGPFPPLPHHGKR